MNIKSFFKNIFTKSAVNSTEGIVFFDSTGRVIGNGIDGFNSITSSNAKPNFFEIEQDAYGRSPWVYIVVDRIASLASSVDLFLMNLEGEPISNRLRQSSKVVELQNLLKEPQQEFTKKSFKALVYTSISNYLLNGNGYMLGLPESKTGSRYTDLITPIASNVSINEDGNAGILFYDVSYFNLNFNHPPEDVLHLAKPNLTKDIHEGHSPMQSLVNIWKANNALNSNEQFIHERKGANGIIFNKDNRTIAPKERDKLQEQIDKVISSQGRIGKYSYLGNEVGFIDLSKSFKDLQAKDSKNDHRETIAAAYNYPSVLLNDNSSSTYNNISSAEKKAYDNAILPVLDMFLKEFNKWLIKDNYKLETIELGYDRKDIPELNLVDKEKTEDNNIKTDIVLKTQAALTSNSISREAAINTLVIAGGFTEDEAESMLILEVNEQNIEPND